MIDDSKVTITLNCSDNKVYVEHEGEGDSKICKQYQEFAYALRHIINTQPYYMQEVVEEYYAEMMPDEGYVEH